MHELHYFGICPFSRSTILLINELKLEFKLIEEKNPLNMINKNQQYPYITNDNSKIISFYAIAEYIIEQNPLHGEILLGKSSIERSKTRSTISWIEQNFYQNATKIILYEKIFKNYKASVPNRSPDSTLLRQSEIELKKYLLYVQSLLEQSEYCAGESITLADFVLAANISILDYLNYIAWGINLKRLKHWYLIIKSRPNFKNLLGTKIAGFQPSPQYAHIDF